MKYDIFATYIYGDPEYLLATYPCLKDFGFAIESRMVPVKRRIWDENGNRIWFTETITKKYACVEIRDLEDLSRLIEAVKNPLVIGEGGKTREIEIYDGYRE